MRRRNRKKKLSIFSYLLAILFLAVLVTAIYFLFFSEIFVINEIEIKPQDDLKYLDQEEISEKIQESLQGKIYGIFLKGNIFLVSPNTIEKNVTLHFPHLESIIVSRSLPQKLYVELKERKNIALWCRAEKIITPIIASSTEDVVSSSTDEILYNRIIRECFYLDDHGVIFKKSPLVRGTSFVNLYDFNSFSLELGEKVLSPAIIEDAILLKNQLKRIIIGNRTIFHEIDLELISNEDIRAKTVFGWQVYFNPSYSLEDQITSLQIILDRESPRTEFDYIDLRIEGRAYYR